MQGVLAKTFEHWFASEISIQNYIGLAEKVKKRKKCGLGKYGLKKHR
jgi:hypothetical protein